MAELTPSQAKRMDELIEAAGGEIGEVVEHRDDGHLIYRIGDTRWAITPRGKVMELAETSGKEEGQKQRAAEREGDSTRRPEREGAGDEEIEGAAPSPPAHADDEEELYRALTAADEAQIMAEIEGRAVDAMVYSFRQDGKPATGLSWVGVQEAVRQMNTRNMGRIAVTDSPPLLERVTIELEVGKTGEGATETMAVEAVRATAYARDEMYGTARWGVAVQPRMYRLRNATDKRGRAIWRPDMFADAKALSKAQRNAMEGMLPLELVEELKATYLGQGKVKYIEATATDVTDLPAPLTDDRAKAQGIRLRELYAEFKQVHPEALRAMPPAEFNRYMVAAQHSHERLDDFIAHMQQRLDEAREAAATEEK
jgi:hypothetical protein